MQSGERFYSDNIDQTLQERDDTRAALGGIENVSELATSNETQEFYLAFCDQMSERTALNQRLAAAIYAAKAFEDDDISDQDEKEALALRAVEAHNELGVIAFELMTGRGQLAKADFNKYYLSLYPEQSEVANDA
jgi:hypothetical protein